MAVGVGKLKKKVFQMPTAWASKVYLYQASFEQDEESDHYERHILSHLSRHFSWNFNSSCVGRSKKLARELKDLIWKRRLHGKTQSIAAASPKIAPPCTPVSKDELFLRYTNLSTSSI
ncbi:hypothetical protein CIPAW_01G256400 [Carya illinoinensis]|uniref:Uncharacterized protein n=1 Tax=Carya illinoinensis TaxID=32201 RepID=A0A8T1RTP1_CARIL|nr:hypothetical protein CIPAW_01G256400 [Carya illinoinensis]KAG6734134.1 hypothetical protein I3842_01G258300 [Carya illinoinensis]